MGVISFKGWGEKCIGELENWSSKMLFYYYSLLLLLLEFINLLA